MIPAAVRRLFVYSFPLVLLFLPSVFPFAVKSLVGSKQCPTGEAHKQYIQYVAARSASAIAASVGALCPKRHGTKDCDSIDGQFVGCHL